MIFISIWTPHQHLFMTNRELTTEEAEAIVLMGLKTKPKMQHSWDQSHSIQLKKHGSSDQISVIGWMDHSSQLQISLPSKIIIIPLLTKRESTSFQISFCLLWRMRLFTLINSQLLFTLIPSKETIKFLFYSSILPLNSWLTLNCSDMKISNLKDLTYSSIQTSQFKELEWQFLMKIKLLLITVWPRTASLFLNTDADRANIDTLLEIMI